MELTATESRLVTMLSRYWLEHPHACDTPDGMRRWWLTGATDVPPHALAAALAWMVVDGLVEASSAADGRTRFRRRAGAPPARLQELAGAGPAACEPDET